MEKDKLLYIDDDPRNTFALKAVLTHRGYACLTAQGTPEGLEVLERHPEIKVILLDMMMPDIDGYETLRILRAGKFKNMPVIAVTAQAMVGDREKCLEAGADAYVSKPINVDELLGIIDEFTNA